MKKILNSTEELTNSHTGLIVNTGDFNYEDFDKFLTISDEIIRNERQRRSQRRTHSVNRRATKTREELFESTNLDDDRFLKALEYQNFSVPLSKNEASSDEARFQKSVENLVNYFDEDIEASSSSKSSSRGKVASAVASFCSKAGNFSFSPLTCRRKQTDVLLELKERYEPSAPGIRTPNCTSFASTPKEKSPKVLRKSKVKQIAQMFNMKISQVVQRDPGANPAHSQFDSKWSQEPKRKTKTSQFRQKLQTMLTTALPNQAVSPESGRKPLLKTHSSTCLVTDIECQSPVKRKVLFPHKSGAESSEGSQPQRAIETSAKEPVGVVVEKEGAVETLRRQLEMKFSSTKGVSMANAKQHCERQTNDGDLPQPREAKSVSSSSGSRAQDLSEPLHVSSLTVVLKPSPERKKPQRRASERFIDESGFVDPQITRNRGTKPSKLFVEHSVPPKEIRRARKEHSVPKTFFQNLHYERSFYNWIREKHNVSSDMTTVDHTAERKQMGQMGDEEEEIGTSKPVDARLTEEVIVELKGQPVVTSGVGVKGGGQRNSKIVQNLLQKKCSFEDSERVEVTENVGMKKKSEALPGHLENKEFRVCENEPSDNSGVEEIESGVSSLPKTSSDESHYDKDSDVKTETVEALKGPRIKKMRRTLTWKTESNLVDSTDSDSDSRQGTTAVFSTLPKIMKSSKGPSNSSSLESVRSEQRVLKGPLIHFANIPLKIRSSVTITSHTPQHGSGAHDSDESRTLCRENSRSWPIFLATGKDEICKLQQKSVFTKLSDSIDEKHELEALMDQGFETGSNETESPVRSVRLLRDRHKFQSVPDQIEDSVGFSTPLKETEGHASTYFSYSTPYEKCSSVGRSHKSRQSLFTQENQDLEQKNSEDVLKCSQNAINSDYDRQKECFSQFWITIGTFTISSVIQYVDPEQLILLNKLLSQKWEQTCELNFGIDEHKFFLLNTSTNNEILKRLQKAEGYSHYWFSSGELLIQFRGAFMSSKEIQSLLACVRECLKSGNLRFGIDDLEFSHPPQPADGNGRSFVDYGNDKVAWPRDPPDDVSGFIYSNINSKGRLAIANSVNNFATLSDGVWI